MLLRRLWLTGIGAALLAGCAATTPYQGVPAPSRLAQLPAADESGVADAVAASVAGASLAIRYQVEGQTRQGHALLTAADDTQPPIVTLVAGEAGDAGGAAEAVLVRDVQDWQQLLHQLQVQITPKGPGEGVMLDVLQEEELLLYYDELGELRTVPMVYKPREVRPVATMRLSELLRAAAAAQAEQLADTAPTLRYVLFNTGDAAATGYPFLLMDLRQSVVHFVQLPLAAEAATAAPPAGRGLHLTLYTVGSQVTGVWTRPFSSVARLFTGVTTTAADTLRPRSLQTLQHRPIPPLNQGPGMGLASWEHELNELVATPALPGRVRYLVDGEAFFGALVHAIDSAEHAISMRLYIFDNDDYALKIADLLKRRSREVEVRILLDGLGTMGGGGSAPAYTPAYFQGGPSSIVEYLQQDSEVQVRVLPNPWLQGDHTKAIIIDGAAAFVGGMNIAREYRYEWHDLMVEASGPVVQALSEDFELAWSRAGALGDWGLFARRRDVRQLEPRAADYPIRALYTRTGRSEILTAQIAAIRRAQRRIYIQNAYFSSDAILYELAKARRRGVDVRVILPLRSDFGVMSRSNAVAANAMLANGIRVYVYPRMSHVKGAVYDGWACFGSANFDRLSLRLNKELNLATSDPQAVQAFVDQVFEPDFAQSVELTEPLPVNWMDHLMELIADQL